MSFFYTPKEIPFMYFSNAIEYTYVQGKGWWRHIYMIRQIFPYYILLFYIFFVYSWSIEFTLVFIQKYHSLLNLSYHPLHIPIYTHQCITNCVLPENDEGFRLFPFLLLIYRISISLDDVFYGLWLLYYNFN